MTATRLSISGYARPRTRAASLRRAVLVLLVIAIVLSPSVTVITGMYSPRGEDLILVSVAAVWFLSLPRQWRKADPLFADSHGNVVFTRIMAGMLYVAVISICVGAIAFQQRLIFNDLMILPMVARYWLILQVGQWAAQRKEQRVFLWALVASLGVSALVGILQHFNLLGINDWLTPLYILEHMEVWDLRLLKLGLPGARVVGTHGDPRHYGYILVTGIGLCVAVVLHLERKAIRLAAVMLFGLCLVAIAFTASRTAILSGVVVLLAAIVVQQRGVRGWGRLVWLLLVLVTVLALVSPAFESSTFQDRILDPYSVSFERSLQARMRDLTVPFEHALEEPIIWVTGRGPAKAEMRSSSHNDFGWYFYRFGFPGLLLYILLVVHGFRFSWRGWSHSAKASDRTICMASLLMCINWLLFAMANATFKDPQLMALNMLLLGACVGACRTEEGD